MKNYIKIALLFVFCVLCAVPVFVQDAHSLRLILKRVVFEEGKRSEVLTLINSSDEEETYRLQWDMMKMTPDDGLERLKKGEEIVGVKLAKDMVKFAPRRVTLAPNSSQQIRMALRMPANLEDGEYRSHLRIRREADVEKIREEAARSGRRQKSTRGVEITMLPGVTIPVIVRKGDLSVSVELVDAEAKSVGNTIQVKFSVLREGQRSVYGDVDFVCNSGAGDEYFLRSTRGVAVYTEINRKNMNVRIKKRENEAVCRSLRISYASTDGYAGDIVEDLAEIVVPVQ